MTFLDGAVNAPSLPGCCAQPKARVQTGIIARASSSLPSPPGRLGAIKMTAPGGNVECIELTAAETTLVGKIDREGMAFEYHPVRGEDTNERAGAIALPSRAGDDIAVGIEAHAFDTTLRPAMVGPECVHQRIMTNRTVLTYGVAAQLARMAFARLAIGD